MEKFINPHKYSHMLQCRTVKFCIYVFGKLLLTTIVGIHVQEPIPDYYLNLNLAILHTYAPSVKS